MKPFKRTTEKVLAWIANVFLILTTAYLSYGAFIQINTIKNNPEIVNQLKTVLADNPQTANFSPEQLLDLVVQGFKVYAVIYIILTVLAIVATLVLNKRILAGVIFLLISISTAVTTVGILLPVYLLHFIVSIMLFVRKEPKQHQEEGLTYL